MQMRANVLDDPLEFVVLLGGQSDAARKRRRREPSGLRRQSPRCVQAMSRDWLQVDEAQRASVSTVSAFILKNGPAAARTSRWMRKASAPCIDIQKNSQRPPLFHPIAVGMRDHHKHDLARLSTVGSVSIAKISGAADCILQNCERRLAAFAPIPVVARIRAHLVAGACRHDVQSLPRARQRDHLHCRPEVDELFEHKITLQSTYVALPEGRELPHTNQNQGERSNFSTRRSERTACPCGPFPSKFREPILPIA